MPGFPRPRRTPARPLTDIAVVVGASLRAPRLANAGAPDLGLPRPPTGSSSEPDPVVTGITNVGGRVLPGDVYAALPGANRHGAEFADEAVGNGAVAVLTDPAGAERLAVGVPVLVVDDVRAALGPAAATIYGDPTALLPVVGITGTAGKTSTAYLIDAGLRAAGRATCLIGTVEARLGDTVLDSERTTPEAPEVHALFAAALEQGVRAAVMEVSSHALAYGRVGGVRFAVGGFTNFGVDHLDFHADVDEYFAAKARLFDGRCRVEVLNLDDPAVRRLVRPGSVTFSAAGDPAASWRAADIAADGFGQRFTAYGPGGLVLPAAVALPGRHNVANALLALASLVALDVDPAVAVEGVASCTGVPGRLERVSAPGPVLGVVDYAHKPDAIVAALAALRELGDGRVITVIGAGGDRDRGKRPLMGAAAAGGSDLVVVTDDNPRGEDPGAIRAGVLTGVRGGAEVVEVAGRREAIAEAVRRARPGDVVAVLGKGHERGQEVACAVHPFDDRTELAAALTARFGGTA